MPRHNCKHKEKRRLYTQQITRQEMQDAIVNTLNMPTYENMIAAEEPAAARLNEYPNEPQKEMSYWRRKEYKPDKYTLPQKDYQHLHYDYQKIPQKCSYQETQKKYHYCKKHGFVPLVMQEHFEKADVNDSDRVQAPHPGEQFSTRQTDSDVTTYTYNRRYDGGIGINFIEYMPKIIEGLKKFVELCNKYPRIASTILSILFLWWVSHQLQGWLTHGAANLVRVGRPAAHWSTVSLEQFSNRLRSFATSSDDLVEGFYCDFARSWCQRFNMMCDVRCSFMDKAIQRLRST